MMRIHTSILALTAVALVAAMSALTAGASAQDSAPSMTVSPQSGVRPLTVTVTGTNCSTSASTSATDSAPRQIRISWQVDGEPWTGQTRLIADGADGDSWNTSLVLGSANLGTNVIDAVCLGGGGQTVLEYPEQKVDVLPLPPVLAASPTSVTVGESITATANQCPDPDGPILGGSYFVRFTLDYLIPPSGTQGPYNESTTVWTSAGGGAQTVFTLPTTAPTEGGAYRITASCQFEELGSSSELFAYTPVAITVSAQTTPTPTPSVSPTATPTPQPTTTPTPTPTPIPGPTPTPQPTPNASSTPVPTPQPTSTPVPGGGGVVIIFTG